MKVSRSRVLMFSRIALRHAVQDAPYGALPVLLAARSAELGLSSAQIGLAITLYATVSALLQPAFGHLSDRLPLRWLTTAATFWTSSFVALAAIAPSYPLLATAVAVAGLGSAAFHPLGAAEATASGAAATGRLAVVESAGGAPGPKQYIRPVCVLTTRRPLETARPRTSPSADADHSVLPVAPDTSVTVLSPPRITTPPATPSANTRPHATSHFCANVSNAYAASLPSPAA